MESIVGRILGNYLSDYVKDFSADKFVDWSLTNLALRESVVQSLVGIPAYLEVRRATCTKIAANVPWASLYSGTQPIVLQFERIEIELEEPVVVTPLEQPATVVVPSKPANSAAANDSYIDRLLQGIKFEIAEVVITVKTLGSPVRLRLRVRDIVVHSTDDSYQTELSHGVRVNRSNTETLQYRHVTLGRASLILVADNGRRETALVDDTPLDVRVKMKRAIGSDVPLAVQVVIELQKVAVRLGAHDYKQFERMLDSLLDCVYRGEAALANAALKEKEKTSSSPVATAAAASPLKPTAAPVESAADAPADTYWGRLTSYFGRSYYAEPAAAAAAPSMDALEDLPSSVPTSNAPSPKLASRASVEDLNRAASKLAEQALLRTKFDELAAQQLESTSQVYFNDSEDFQHTVYTFKVMQGTLEALENVLQQPRRLALLEFEQLRCQFVPMVVRAIGAQSEARVTIGSLSVTRNESPDVYRGYERVVVAGGRVDAGDVRGELDDESDDSGGADDDNDKQRLPSFVLTYVRRDPESEAIKKALLSGADRFHRKVHIQTRDWTVIYDHRFWARVYQFFFGSELGSKFETYVDASVEMALGVVVTERVDVRVVALHNTLILPPFAGYGGPLPLASYVLRLATDRASFGSSDAEANWQASSRVPDDMCVGLFADTSASFPHRVGDYSNAETFIARNSEKNDAARFGTPSRSQRFAMRLANTCCTMQDAPDAPLRTVLEPATVDIDVALQEYSRRSPLLELAQQAQQRINPRLEIYVRIRDMSMALTHAQYVYMLHVLDQRLAWSAAQLTEQQRAERIMEEIVRAADSGQTAVSAAEIERHVDELQLKRLEAVRDALKFVALVDMNRLRLTLYDDVVTGGNADDVLAHVHLTRCQMAVESDLRQSTIKMLVDDVQYRSPQYADTPFGALFEALSPQRSVLSLRYDTNSDTHAVHASVGLHSLRIMLLLDAIAKLQLFFDDKLARPEGAPNAAVEALRATLRDAYSGSLSSQSTQSAGLDYDVQLDGCEVALIETPTVNEFVPMFIERGTVSRRSPTPLLTSVVIDTHGVTLFAYMRETPEAPRRRDQLCTPVRLRVFWNQWRPSLNDAWVSDIILLFDDFVVALTRPQLVMLQNILDYQLEGLAEAGKLQTTAIDLSATGDNAPTAVADDRRRGSFVIQILQWRLSLKRDDVRDLASAAVGEFATFTAQDFVYATEDSPHEWRMLVSAADLTLRDHQPSIPMFETVIRSKASTGAYGRAAGVAAESRASAVPALAPPNGSNARLSAAHRRSMLRDALRPIEAKVPQREARRYRGSTKSRVDVGDRDAWKLIVATAKENKSFHGMISKRGDTQLLRIDHVSRLEFGRAAAPTTSASYRHDLDRRRSELAQQVALRGNDGEILYQLAYVHARLGEQQMCVDTLERAVVAGFDDWTRVEMDNAFDSVRTLPRFAEVAAMRRQRSSTSSKRRFRATLRDSAATKERAESSNRWLTRWVFEINPMLVVYTASFATKMQAFFQLLDEQKNLRKQYNRISSQLASLSVDASMLGSQQPAPAAPPLAERDPDDDDNDVSDGEAAATTTAVPAAEAAAAAGPPTTTVIKLVLRQPTLLFPEQLSDDGISVGQVDLDTLFASNDNESSARSSTMRRTDIFVSQAQLLLEVITTDVKVDDDSAVLLFDADERDAGNADSAARAALNVALVHSVSVVDPMNMNAQVLAKQRALSDDAPYTSVSVDIDLVAVRLSLHKSSRAVEAIQKYLSNVIAQHASTDASPSAPTEAVDRRIRLVANDVRLTVVADYASNLELFFVYGKNAEAFVMNYAAERYTDFALSVRLEVHVNDLNFMIPEVLIGATQLSIDGSSGVWLDESMMSDDLPPAAAAPTGDDDAESAALSLRLVSLERISLRLTNEVVRHMLEIYNLQDTHNDMSSHFQYILVNHTEAPLGYSQTNTSDVQTLAADGQVPFSFTNPYRRKLLDFYVEGWGTASGFGIDDAGHTLVRICADTDYEVRRELIVRIRPRELKRYVEFYAAHELVNDTDTELEFELDYSAEVLRTKSVRRLYTCAAGARAAFACDASWRAAMRLRPDADWNWGSALGVDDGPSVNVNDSGDVVDVNGGAAPTAVLISSPLMQQHRTLLVSRERDRRGRLILRVSAPLTLENVTPFAVEFAHGDRARGGAIAPGAARCVYDTALLNAPLSFRLLPYDVWSPPAPQKRGLLQSGAVPVRRNVVPAGERHELMLTLTAAGKLGRARNLYIGVPFVLANRSDVRLELMQHGREDGVSLGVHDTKPFSWHPTGLHRFAVRVVCRLTGARTEWSEPQRLKVARESSITVALPGGSPIRYTVRFSVKQTDANTCLVVFSPRFVFSNALPRPLQVEQNVEIALNSLRFTVPANGRVGSSLITRTAFVTTLPSSESEQWSVEPFVLGARASGESDETSSLMNRVADVAGMALAGVGVNDNAKIGGDPAKAGTEAEGDGVRENVSLVLHNGLSDEVLPLVVGIVEHTTRSSTVRFQTMRTAPIVVANDTNRALLVRIADTCLPAVGTTDHSSYQRLNGAQSPCQWRKVVRVAPHADADLLVPPLATLPPSAQVAYENDGGSESVLEWSAPFVVDVRRAARRHADQTIAFGAAARLGGSRHRRARSPSPRRMAVSTDSQQDEVSSSPNLAASWQRQGRSFLLRVRDAPLEDPRSSRIARASMPWTSNFLGVGDSIARASTSLLQASLSSESLPALSVSGAPGNSSSNHNNNNNGGAASAATEVAQRIVLRLPLLEISFAVDADASESLWFRFRDTALTLVRRRGGDAHTHFTLGRIEADATGEAVEYPLLISPQLDSLAQDSNMVELLIEWHKGARVRTVDYVGLRVLPLVLKIDAGVLAFYTDIGQLLWPSSNADDTDVFATRRTHGMVARRRHAELAAFLSSDGIGAAVDDDDAAGDVDADTLLHKLVVFPMRVTLCVGNNSAGWPVIADEANIQMTLFTRANVFGDRWRIVSQLWGAYAQIGWTEVYKIIASLDAIGSPLATMRKLGRGAKDFVVLPVESLVLDDTPGAFVVGVWRGTVSLFKNAADAFITTLMRLFLTLAWLFTLVSIDPYYRKHKARMLRRHPTSLWAAALDGGYELIWSWGQAFGGPVLVPMHWFDTLSWFAVPLGAIVAVITLPFKLVGGVFDMVARLFEGSLTVLHVGSDSRYRETREPPTVRHVAAAMAERFVRKQLAFKETLHCAALCRVVTRTQRLRTRYVALTDSNIWIVNTSRLADSADRLYRPKSVPTFLVDTVELPQSPETTFHVCTASRVLGGRSRFTFIVPNRSAFAEGFAKLDVTVEQTNSESVEALLHRVDTYSQPLPVRSINNQDDFSMASSLADNDGMDDGLGDGDDDVAIGNDDGKRRLRASSVRANALSENAFARLGSSTDRVFFPERRSSVYSSQRAMSQKLLVASPSIAARRPTGASSTANYNLSNSAVATPATELTTLSNEQ